ncbi:hypothetical protein [Spirochaeta thermophila]|uniref:Uncharacterized protein n=1 Tax=Winmispira thermophila (strain ATCC 49972 / DSM 6192 / RI 19.B1) TaxID=665571 RepID=E0RQ31_WINT6|nr:hypothetical protein [Spirochaeta thermophila]ADN01415.1 hypothetical protein STHERM_c04430 [Spirochaeta thermophila DSM 6192]
MRHVLDQRFDVGLVVLFFLSTLALIGSGYVFLGGRLEDRDAGGVRLVLGGEGLQVEEMGLPLSAGSVYRVSGDGEAVWAVSLPVLWREAGLVVVLYDGTGAVVDVRFPYGLEAGGDDPYDTDRLRRLLLDRSARRLWHEVKGVDPLLLRKVEEAVRLGRSLLEEGGLL